MVYLAETIKFHRHPGSVGGISRTMAGHVLYRCSCGSEGTLVMYALKAPRFVSEVVSPFFSASDLLAVLLKPFVHMRSPADPVKKLRGQKCY